MQFMCVGCWACVTYLRYTVLTSPNKGETAVHCCDPALSVRAMLVSRNVFHVVSALQSIFSVKKKECISLNILLLILDSTILQRWEWAHHPWWSVFAARPENTLKSLVTVHGHLNCFRYKVILTLPSAL